MTPLQKLIEEFKDKPFVEKAFLFQLLKSRALKTFRGEKLPFGTFNPSLKEVIFLGGKLGLIKVRNIEPVCAAEYVNI